MNDFKLLAIRPRKGCDKKYLKVLKKDTLYQFYNDYNFTFSNETNEIIDIKPVNDKSLRLYDINVGGKLLPINISAIVGKNGSGKSAITELFCLVMFFCGIKHEMIDIEDWESKFPKIKLRLNEYIHIELYFQISEKFYLLNVLNTSTTEYKLELKEYQKKGNDQKYHFVNLFDTPEHSTKAYKVLLNNLFYSVVINYSIHALNEKQVGDWIIPLFAKNDGYSLPLVINPFRKKGNFDINTENDLLRQRLLANILEPLGELLPENSLRNVFQKTLRNGNVESKVLETVELEYDIYDKKRQEKELTPQELECLKYLFEQYTGEEYKSDSKDEQVVRYIIYKLHSTGHVYPSYNKLYNEDDNLFIGEDEKISVVDFANKIIEDESHVTYKIKQAINFLLYKHIPGYVEESGNYMDYENRTSVTKTLDEISKIIEDIKKDNPKRNLKTIELIPPSFFKCNLYLTDQSNFDELSSGERQRISAISSLVYHLINISSVHENSTKNTYRYNYVNIIFDEIELYYHPDLQRTFIQDMLAYIQKVNPVKLNNILGVNFCFVTHSPYILSDIPMSNLLLLEDGKPQEFKKIRQTLGANIHDLLADSFFMSEGYMGEFTKQKIEDSINFLNYYKMEKDINVLKSKLSDSTETDDLTKKISEFEEKKKKIPRVEIHDLEYHRKLIDIIGEPILKNKLMDMFFSVFPEKIDVNQTKQQILRLIKQAGLSKQDIFEN